MDEIAELPLEITVDEDWVGYCNARVVTRMRELHEGPMTHLLLVPNSAEKWVALVPTADGDAYGAVSLAFTETENAAKVNVRLGLRGVKVSKLKGRVRVYALKEVAAPNGRSYLAIDTSRSSSRPTQGRRTVKSG